MTNPDTNPKDLIKSGASHNIPTSEDLTYPNLEVGLTDHEKGYKEQQLLELKTNQDLRISYARKIFWLVSIWLTCVVAAVIAAGWSSETNFVLADNVLIAFIATTTINVLGLFAIVMKWLFKYR